MLDSQYIPSFLSEDEANRVLANLNNEITYLDRKSMTFSIFGKTVPLPRDKAFYGDVAPDGSYPLYRYGGNRYPAVQPWTPTLKEMRDLIAERTGHFCNHVVVNRYVDGDDHISFHRDKTRDFEKNSSVCTLSLGGTRRLDFKNNMGSELEDWEFGVAHGSLFIMGWQTNHEMKHRIAKTTKVCPTRISLTFRNIKTRADKSGRLIK
ncbi:hypothetical protein HK104_003700 [Borealophlyctis nickersoniae]|nr:hypothetical protein HK104_003700 [Borealophlyctis nickersoniae]